MNDNNCTKMGAWRTSNPDRYGILKIYAKENRKNMTQAEHLLWEHIRDSKLGVLFVRQQIIGDYIVDFMCRQPNNPKDGTIGEGRLIIEIDGGYHIERHKLVKYPNIEKLYSPSYNIETYIVDQVEEDGIRQTWLENMGFRVIRFTNEQVQSDINKTIEIIKKHI